MNTRLQIVYVPVGEVRPANYNPRDISDEALASLKVSIQTFGVPQPLVINTRSGNLVSGHQRLRAMIELAFSEVPVVYVDLDDAMEKALNLTLNNQHITGFFTEALGGILGELKAALPGTLYTAVRLGMLEPALDWKPGDEVDNTDENLDGIKGKIGIRCLPEDVQELKNYLDRKIAETSFEGVEIV